jgi:hypothetical protein
MTSSARTLATSNEIRDRDADLVWIMAGVGDRRRNLYRRGTRRAPPAAGLLDTVRKAVL